MKVLKKLRLSFNLNQEELANKLLIKHNTISQYETDLYPSFKIIKKISELFKVSTDFLLLEDKCFYPKTINFINLAIKLDENNNSNLKKLIKNNIINLIKDMNNLKIEIKLDNIKEKLNNNFHSNLKILRNQNNITQNQLSNELDIVRSVVGMYEIKNYPSIDKMIKLSEIFNCSIHALVTGEKLSFNFKDKNFGKTILIADHLLSIEDKKFLFKLMGNMIKK